MIINTPTFICAVTLSEENMVYSSFQIKRKE